MQIKYANEGSLVVEIFENLASLTVDFFGSLARLTADFFGSLASLTVDFFRTLTLHHINPEITSFNVMLVEVSKVKS